MEVVVPFSPTDPKTRLSPVLAASERAAFARVLLGDVLDALAATPDVPAPTILSTAPLDDAGDASTASSDDGDETAGSLDDRDVDVVVDERALTPAVNDVLAAADDAVAVVMADLALATPASLEKLFAPDADVVLAPGRRAGTNALVARHPAFRVDYHGPSFVDHREAAAALDASVHVVDSHRLATDVDEPEDLVEVLAHGDGAAADWLRERGFALAERADGSVHVERNDS